MNSFKWLDNYCPISNKIHNNQIENSLNSYFPNKMHYSSFTCKNFFCIMSVLSVYYTGSRSRHKNVICIKITFHFFAIQSTLHYQRLYFFLETLSLMLRLQEGPAIKLNHSGGHKKKSPNSARIKNSILVLLLLIEKVTLGPHRGKRYVVRVGKNP